MKNNRTFLEKLLDGAEVEWKTVKSLCNDNFWLMPATPEFDDNGTIPYITSKNIKGGKIDFQNTKYINEHVYQELSRTRCIIENDILISMIGTIGEAVIVKKEDLFFYGQNMYILRLNNKLVNYKFFLYYFTAPFILNSLLSKKNSSNQGYLKAGQIENLKIPIPPLSVQTEIVKILDALTALTSELTCELILRQKQYEYYREKLLSEEELGKVGGKWKNLKDVLINLRTGLNPRNNFKLNTDGADNYYITVRELDSVNIKITDKTDKISNQAREIIDKRSKLNIGDILFSGTGTIGKTAFISELPRNWNIKEGVYALTVNQEIIKPMYLLRLLQSEITKKQINNFVMGSTVKSISMADLKKVKILIPSLDEQQRIVSILDKFEALTNPITEGLPLAIEQSQKRYEYYRELLLSFS
ncbi:TPA: restriction endonuclease subunit S [Haemophilus influenzae]